MTLHFVGMTSDVEMAIYLSEMLIGACKRSLATYVEELPRYPDAQRMKQIRKGFIEGFARKINDRLEQLTEERRRAHAGRATGTSVVVVKDGAIKEFMTGSGIRIKGSTESKMKGHADYNAWDAGATAGGKVSLGRPLDGAGDPSAPRLGQ